jgi:hypothetical protein
MAGVWGGGDESGEVMMDELELNEAQGLTASMVRDRLEKEGHPVRECRQFEVCKYLGAHTHHGAGNSDFTVPDEWDGPRQRKTMLQASLNLLAAMLGKSTQELLIEINPRMRKGLPSEAAIDAHRQVGGMWTGTYGTVGGGGFVVFCSFMTEPSDNPAAGPLVVWDDEEFHDSEWQKEQLQNYWHFWPCDAHGNKVRWPTDDHGAML